MRGPPPQNRRTGARAPGSFPFGDLNPRVFSSTQPYLGTPGLERTILEYPDYCIRSSISWRMETAATRGSGHYVGRGARKRNENETIRKIATASSSSLPGQPNAQHRSAQCPSRRAIRGSPQSAIGRAGRVTKVHPPRGGESVALLLRVTEPRQ